MPDCLRPLPILLVYMALAPRASAQLPDPGVQLLARFAVSHSTR